MSVVIAFGGVITDMILAAKSISGKKQYVSLFGSVIIILLLGYCFSIASVGASPSNESGFFGGAVSGIGYFRINRFFPLSAAFCMISAILQWLSRVLGKHGENNFENI